MYTVPKKSDFIAVYENNKFLIWLLFSYSTLFLVLFKFMPGPNNIVLITIFYFFLLLSMLILVSRLGTIRILKRYKIISFIFALLLIVGFIIRYFLIKPAPERLFIAVILAEYARNMYLSARFYGWPLLLNIFFLVFKSNIRNIFLLNIVLGSITPITFYFLANEMFNSRKTSFIALILFFLSPLYLYISSTESQTAVAMFFTILTFIFLFRYLKSKKTMLLILSLSNLYLAVTMRAEYFFVLIIFFITFITLNNLKLTRSQKIIIVVFFVLLTPYNSNLLHYYFGSKADVGIHGKIMDNSNFVGSYLPTYVQLFKTNIIPNLRFLLSNNSILLINVVSAIYGIYFLYRKNKQLLSVLLLFFTIFFIAYTSMLFEYFFLSTKYHPILLIPILLLSAYGIFSVYNVFKNTTLSKIVLVLFFIMVIIGSFNFLNIYKHTKYTKPNYQEQLMFLDSEINRGCGLDTNRNNSLLSFCNVSDLDSFIVLKCLGHVQCQFIFSEYFDINDNSSTYNIEGFKVTVLNKLMFVNEIIAEKPMLVFLCE